MHPSGVKKSKRSRRSDPVIADGVKVTFYTDPLCCWTWAMWPQWQQFCAELPTASSVDYKMAGLLPSWKHFQDTINAITKPIQMGPEWAHAKAIGQVPINDRIWIDDPPASSYPACIAVKAVELQSARASESYFNSLQEAVMVHSHNIADTAVLLKYAAQLAGKFPGFDPFLFREDLLGERGKAAFSKDLQETEYLRIVRLPTLVVRNTGRPAQVLSGYQTYDSLRQTMV